MWVTLVTAAAWPRSKASGTLCWGAQHEATAKSDVARDVRAHRYHTSLEGKLHAVLAARNTRRRRKAMWRGTFGRIDIVHHEDLAIFRRMTYVCSQVVRACGDTAAEQLSRVTWRVDRFFRHKIVTVALP
jgi:succinylarginine dihydrolase